MQVTRTMQVKDLLEQVLDVSSAPKDAFLTVKNSHTPGAPPKKLDDIKMLLATLFEENHTLHFTVIKPSVGGKSPRPAAPKQTQKA